MDKYFAKNTRESIMSGDVSAMKSEYEWMIRNYSKHQEAAKPGVGIFSPMFFIGGTQLQGRILLLPQGGKEDKDSDCVSLYLYLVGRGNKTVRARFKFYLLDIAGTEYASYEGVNNFTRGKGFGIAKFAEHDLINSLLIADDLTVRCTIATQRPDEEELDKFILSLLLNSVDTKKLNITEKKELLQESLKGQIENEFSDVTLVCRGVEFRAHRNILASRSYAFYEVFINQSIGPDNRVITNDIEPEVLREVLRYIYTGTIQNWGVHRGLIEAADKFCLLDLKNFCSNILMNTMTVNNVVEMLMLSDKHNMRDLKSSALSVMAMQAQSVVMTPGFTSLLESQRTDLIAEVFTALTGVQSVLSIE